jgi:hypothetical protein
LKILRKGDFANKECGTGAELVWMVIYVGLSILAAQLMKKKFKSPIQDDKPTTLTTRGSYITWVNGIRMAGPCFGWAGERRKKKEKLSGGKGGSSPKQDVWYEAGWHQLSVGPCHALHGITQAGTPIMSGVITSVSHPSGSTIDLGKEGSFQIYWGEPTQPICSLLADPSRLGIASKWPYCCYIYWIEKRLGTSANWQILNYELERRPTNGVLTLSQPWYEPTPILSGVTATITGNVGSAAPDTGYIEVAGDFTQELDPGQPMALTGNGLANGNYVVRRATLVFVVIGTTWDGFPIKTPRTRIFLETGTAGSNAVGTVEAFTFATDNGANVAHAIAELLFAPYPLGLELGQGEPEPWDIQSLEALGMEAEADGWRASLVGVDGESAQAILGTALQDHGTMVPFDTSTGMLKFQRVREPVGILPNLTAFLRSDKRPEIESLHGEKTADIMVFSFTDRDHGYSDMTIGESEDGQISYMKHARPKTVQMASIVHFTTASHLLALRSQEELAGAGVFRIEASRGARTLIPGMAIVDDDFDEVLRVIAVSPDVLSETTQISVFPDFFGGRKSDFVADPFGGSSGHLKTELNKETIALEIPEQLLTTEEMFLIVPQIRAHAQINESAIHISRDDSSYTLLGSEDGYATGGLTDVALAADSYTFLTNGPTFLLEGPDIGTALDLSADPTNFGLGRQLVVIYSSAGMEICFAQKITAMGGLQYRLDGLLRARYDTRKLTHPIGAQVFIFENTTFDAFQDILLQPAEDLYVKAQPIGSLGSMGLNAVPAFGMLLRGKGLVPIDPENLHTQAPFLGSPVWRTGDDVTVAWSWSSSVGKSTGAGFQAAGAAIGTAIPKGFFIVELLTAGGVVVSTQHLIVAVVVYATATLAAAPISNGTFKVRVTHSYNGYSSNPITYTVTHI